MGDKQIHVVCLVALDGRGFFFATKRPRGKSLALHWEFPGGKVESGEHPENALRREIKEDFYGHSGILNLSPKLFMNMILALSG